MGRVKGPQKRTKDTVIIRLRQLCEDRYFGSYTNMSKATGISKAAICRVLKDCQPPAHLILNLAQRTDVDLDWLFGRDLKPLDSYIDQAISLLLRANQKIRGANETARRSTNSNTR